MELIRFTLSMIHISWASIQVLPMSIIPAIDRLLKDFFFNHWDSGPYLHPIAWESICLPRKLGGMGIPNIWGINWVALLRQVQHVIWDYLTCWNLWVYAKYLRQKSFGDIKVSKSTSWCWRGILSLRPLALPYIKHLIGDGRSTNF